MRSRDVLAFLDMSRRKFVGYELENDLTSTAGLPSPIKEGARVLERVSIRPPCWPGWATPCNASVSVQPEERALCAESQSFRRGK